MKTLGLVLAGGRSTRLGGGVKGLLDLGGQPMLARVIARLVQQVSAVVLNANCDPALLKQFGLPVLPDSIGGAAGPLAGVLAGLDHAAQTGFTRVVSVSSDSPFFPDDLLARLSAALEHSGSAIAMAAQRTGDGRLSREPAFALWPASLREDLRGALWKGVRKVVDWADPQGCVPVEFPAGPDDPFFNVNTPEDLAVARARVARQAA